MSIHSVIISPAKSKQKYQNKRRKNYGCTDGNRLGQFGAKEILPISEGSASGWRFSVDEFLLALEANQLPQPQVPETKNQTHEPQLQSV